MAFVTTCLVFGFLLLGLLGGETMASSNCNFPAIYNFGDSNSDTGGRSASFDALPLPFGETFFGKPSGRFCDGRLVIDFIAEQLGLPYLSAYLDSIGTSFRHGANFAFGGSSIRVGGYSPFHLSIQISQFRQLKARTTDLYGQRQGKARTPSSKWNLPKPEDFSKALYTFDIGQNDLAYGFQHTTEDQVRESIPDMLDQLSDAIQFCDCCCVVDGGGQTLYEEGARVFWIHNTGPLGCLPYSFIYDQSKPGNLDEGGCVKPENDVAQEFNRQLKDRVTQFRLRLPHAAFTYVDVYSVKYELVSNATKQGFDDPMKFCCGSYYGYHVDCGKTAVVNGTTYGKACSNPRAQVSWDGIHYSEEANRRIADRLLGGQMSDPPVPITQACRKS
ncbi:PREDICTED: GDSL esterase/lipase At5g14450 isoform X2 [Nelumbo nucifera]|uniref:GDSL esterase/lipase At5g14450 isoform X2 n=1 Tax=Nelumbo nucifera TaxID=4432 RepID=A0A1U7YS26_NELNU|nr:PREDICTED: GDSL esterase/lipase At5g14450 isoform X2 [Nelumbo nucifera]